MKLKTKKILAALLGITLILFLLSFVNSAVGNPISNTLAKNAAQKYINKNYSNLNLEIIRSNYNFKFGSYVVFCQSTNSVDTAFSVLVDSFGNVLSDEYEYEVANNFTTYRRLNDELRTIGDKLLRDNLKYNISNALFIMDMSKEDILQLTKDMPLDINNPPAKLEASIYIIDNDVTYKKVAEVLKKMAEVCSKENLTISTYSIRIECDESLKDESKTKEKNFISLYNIPAKILQSDDLPKALQELDEE